MSGAARLSKDGEPRYVITLVHGTFAVGAEWTRPGSRLCKAIEAELGAGQVRFEGFDWPGFLGTSLNNGHRYRLRAGWHLAGALKSRFDTFPKTRHFVIAHSHGGNVALYALRDASVRARLQGTVCIGTPFIQCEPRVIEAAIPIYASLILGAAILAVLALFGLVLAPAAYFMPDQTVLYQGHGYKVTPLWLFQLAVLILGVCYYPRIERHFRAWLLSWADRERRGIMGRLGLPGGDGPPVLCVQARGDEAARHLSMVRLAGDIPYWLWLGGLYAVLFLVAAGSALAWPELLPPLLQDPYGFTRRFAGQFWPEAAAWPPDDAFPWLKMTDSLMRWRPLWWIVGAVAGGMGAVMLVLFVHLAAMVLVPRLVRAHALGFGQETVLDNLLVRIGAKPIPSGFPVQLQEYNIACEGLRHSGLYEDPQVLADIAAWIREPGKPRFRHAYRSVAGGPDHQAVGPTASPQQPKKDASWTN